MKTKKSKQIVFVCTGNICRSPMAEYLMRHHLRGGNEWITASAGVFATPGLPASAAAVTVLRDKGIDMTPHRSRLLTRDIVDEAAWILVMTTAHALEVQLRYPAVAERVRLLASFGGGGEREVSDPIGGSVEIYRGICQEIEAALLDLILFLKKRE